MKHLLLTLTLFTSFFASAQIVNIPDANFKNALLNYNPGRWSKPFKQFKSTICLCR